MSMVTLAAIREGYRAVGPGVGDAMLRLFGQGTAFPDAAWPRWQVIDLISGRRSRARKVVAEDLLGGIPSHWQVTRVEPQSFRSAEGSVVVTGHIVCRPPGPAGLWELVRVPFAHIWYLRDGRAVRVRDYLDGIDLVRA